MNKTLLLNCIITPDGTRLESRSRWDYKSHVDTITSETYIVDGGLNYLRGSVNKVQPTYLHTYLEDPITTIRERVSWGRNYDKNMNPLPETEWVLIKDLTTDHIINIVEGNYCGESFKNVFKRELYYRERLCITT